MAVLAALAEELTSAAWSAEAAVLPFLAIYRQIRDFGLLFGDGKFELAIYRQSPKFRDFESQSGDIGEF